MLVSVYYEERRYIILIKKHSSSEMEDFVETLIFASCV